MGRGVDGGWGAEARGVTIAGGAVAALAAVAVVVLRVGCEAGVCSCRALAEGAGPVAEPAAEPVAALAAEALIAAMLRALAARPVSGGAAAAGAAVGIVPFCCVPCVRWVGV